MTDYLDVNAVPESELLTREQTAILWKMLESLPDETRECLCYGTYWDGKLIGLPLI